ncbi:YjbQ family protein [Metallosphaera tengchongensis]|uniref:YjbQ family protein n=1 Tax=Metallosphaera tengchongensis TaxID=1532350 RepID=A0A6N0NUD4_9CREN|nr:secondary thiamine-phosphate synthase enzyme YjbQ [Metallosphaera tengchongensis]QKQ99736.1 YjbQ family protein [Metallosphaera tengchongensis]
MKVVTKEIEVRTTSKFQSMDITDLVEAEIGSVKEGVAYIFVKHTTCSIIVNEPESGLMEDYLNWMRKIVPPDGEFKHNIIDNNGHAHISAMLIGNSRVIPVAGGKLDLGTWQRVILLEFDGPRVRKVQVKVIGE